MSKRSRSRKPDSIRSKKELEQRESRTIKGLDGTMDAIIAKLEAKKPLSEEEIRFTKKYGELRAASVEREKGTREGVEAISDEKLRDMVENIWKVKMALNKIGIATKEELFEKAGYYRCKFCKELHSIDTKCPILELLDQYKEIKDHRPTDRELDELLD